VSLSIRARLTLWYTTVLSVVLAVSGAALYVVHSRSRLARLDEELARAGALLARIVPSDLEEGLDLSEAARSALEDVEMPGRTLAIFDANGVPLSSRWEALPQAAAAVLGERGQANETLETPAGAFRLYRARHEYRDTSYQVGVAESLAPVLDELARLRHALLGSFLFALLLAVVGGWAIARAALQPVTLMAAQARRITDRTPGFRLSSPNPKDELGLLAKAFNDLLARLESALSQQRQFMADASHELRTPVSIARTALEVTLSRSGRPEEEYRDSLGVVAGQMRRLSRIVEDMFTLARADASGLPLERRPIYLDELVADCVKEAKVLAAPKGVALECQGPGDLEVHGDERLLRHMLINLLDNAIHYTPSGGWVRVDHATRADAVEVSVTDSGEGIPEMERERIFQRFVQADAARSGNGAGLGLPIARAIAEAHGGTLVLDRSDASGSRFLVRLPLPGARPDASVIIRSSRPT
jgi:heavy metal sensor kinase